MSKLRCTIVTWNAEGKVIGVATSNTDHEHCKTAAGYYDDDAAGSAVLWHSGPFPGRGTDLAAAAKAIERFTLSEASMTEQGKRRSLYDD